MRTSTISPYGEAKNSPPASADMLYTANAKNPSSRYFKLRSGRSSQRGSTKLRRNMKRPSFHKYSDTVPSGHSQEQNDLRSSHDISRNAVNRKNAAGCTRGNVPVSSTYLDSISPAIGSQPSTPAGRATSRVAPAVSAHRTH